MDQGHQDYQLFLKGDEEALVRLIDTYKEGLLLYLNGIVSDWAAAEELTEDTFLKLVLKKPRFSAKSGFKTWLYTIARNVAVDEMRKRKNLSPTSLEELENRLRSRGDTSQDQIQLRLDRAGWEMEQSKQYDYIVVNDQVKTCVQKILHIIAKSCDEE